MTVRGRSERLNRCRGTSRSRTIASEGAELEEAKRERDQFRALAMRAQADLENYRRRAAEEREELRRFGQSALILKILEVADDLARALEHIPEDAVASGWRDGLEMVNRRFDHLLETEGVKPIEAQGAPFDPTQHEAISFEETADSEAGRVTAVIRQGYIQNGRVLRAAQVAVARAQASEEDSSGG